MSIKKIHIYVIDDGILNRKTNLIYALRFLVLQRNFDK